MACIVRAIIYHDDIEEGGEQGYANPPTLAFLSPNLSIRQNFCSNPKPEPHPKVEV